MALPRLLRDGVARPKGGPVRRIAIEDIEAFLDQAGKNEAKLVTLSKVAEAARVLVGHVSVDNRNAAWIAATHVSAALAELDDSEIGGKT